MHHICHKRSTLVKRNYTEQWSVAVIRHHSHHVEIDTIFLLLCGRVLFLLEKGSAKRIYFSWGLYVHWFDNNTWKKGFIIWKIWRNVIENMESEPKIHLWMMDFLKLCSLENKSFLSSVNLLIIFSQDLRSLIQLETIFKNLVGYL